MIFLLVLCLTFLTTTTFSENVGNGYSKLTINDKADKAIVQLNNYITKNGHSTSSVPDHSPKFEINVGTLTVAGNVSLTNGTVRGLDTFKRVDDCTLVSTGNKHKIDLSLELSNITFNFDYKFNFLNVNETGQIDGFVKDSIHNLKINVVKVSEKKKAYLKKYKHTNKGEMEVNIHGSKFPDVIVNHLKNQLVTYLKPYCDKYLSNWVRVVTQHVLDFVNKSF